MIRSPWFQTTTEDKHNTTIVIYYSRTVSGNLIEIDTYLDLNDFKPMDPLVRFSELGPYFYVPLFSCIFLWNGKESS